jgi:hypothetical protein
METTTQEPTMSTQTTHWSVERNLANDGWIRLVATDAGTCAVACDEHGEPLPKTPEPADRFRECDAPTLAAQIGSRNILAISGGRVIRRDTGITLPVHYGYSVTVDLAANDTYTVRRVFTRGAKTWVKGERTNVYCDAVGEAAYQAACFQNVEF